VNFVATPRLDLIPHSPAGLLALIEGVRQFEAVTGLVAADGLRDFMVSPDVSPEWLARLRTAAAADPWVHGFAVTLRDDRSVIGSAAFKGPPDPGGCVEIAYGIVPARQGHGYATEAATALIEWAFGDARVRTVRAHTLPAPGASPRVLAKCGFAFAGEVVDPQDGPVWRWEKARDQPKGHA
jgi:RimJ/RimL family protein N-acetyltransferase